MKTIAVKRKNGVYISTYGFSEVSSRNESYIKSYLCGIMDCLDIPLKQEFTIGEAVIMINAERKNND